MPRDFRIQVFYMDQFPQAPDYTLRAVSYFSENSRRYPQLRVHHQYRWYRWSTLTCEYLRELSKKVEMTLVLFQMIHEKIMKQKISWHCPFKGCFVEGCCGQVQRSGLQWASWGLWHAPFFVEGCSVHRAAFVIIARAPCTLCTICSRVLGACTCLGLHYTVQCTVQLSELTACNGATNYAWFAA